MHERRNHNGNGNGSKLAKATIVETVISGRFGMGLSKDAVRRAREEQRKIEEAKHEVDRQLNRGKKKH